jgi:hypothetical protein
MEMQTFMTEVTPAIAKEWLSKNVANRKLKTNKVDQFARDMASGNWQPTHQGIAFYEDGTLADGQHRLKAIVQADKPVLMLVTMNLSKSALMAVDMGTPREAHDIAKLGGYPDWINPSTIAIVRALLGKLHNVKATASFAEIVNYCNKYSNSIIFAHAVTSSRKRGLTAAVIGACYVCAVEAGLPKEKIKRFAEIMYTGEIHKLEENSAIRLREFLLLNNNCWAGIEKFETAKKIQRCLYSFCNGTPMERLASQASLKFPIPE